MKKIYLPVVALALIVTSSFATVAFAESNNTQDGSVGAKVGINGGFNRGIGEMMRGKSRIGNGVFGTVTTISGNTITISSKVYDVNKAQTVITYTVNAANATVIKAGVASSVANIAVGDVITVQGTVSGTSVTATSIRDGKGMMNNGNTQNSQGTILDGNGQPVIGGKVTSVSGSSVTITNKSNVSYIVDLTNAKITKNGVVSTVTNVAVGDTVLAQGTINGTSVSAVTLVDQGVVVNTTTDSTQKGFFGRIGDFFSHMFGL